MIIVPIYGYISFNCCLSHTFQLKLGHNWNIFLVEIKITAAEESVISPAMVIPTSHDKAKYTQLLIIIHWLGKVLKRVEDGRERRIVG